MDDQPAPPAQDRTAPPRASPPQAAPPRTAPPRTAPPRTAPPRAASPQGAPPRTAPPATPEPTRAATPAPGVELGDRWKRLARPGGLFPDEAAGTDDALQAQRQGLRAAVERPDPASRLEGVREVLGDCSRCGLCEGRRNIVFGVGDPGARLVVLGEGPGEQEDLQAEPFVGPAGQMLDRMIENVLGLRRDQVYIVNMVKCRPPRNRNPQAEELAACRPFLLAQLASIRPDLVLVLGSVASRALWGGGITKLRGQWQEIRWPGGRARVLPTFHPAFLIRRAQAGSREEKLQTFEDLKLLRAELDALPPR
ncbi:MAG: uracil-DNA glycosylase [Alphaproteobacteria bacterium]|nr:uracil-DNA glycosylase [Alphaproteobacteria bacterium]